MAQRTHADKRDEATGPDVYLPAGVDTSFDGSRLESIWAALFNHGV